MRAVMSDKLRKILRDPQGRRELQQALVRLDVTKNKSTEISVGNDRYQIQFMPAELRSK
ncbi:MAG: hypothetical protein JSR33_08455 [Proteobacteria bacterium]|nr:hypothetical protein [Pseudomonadota bacterium]